MDDYIKSLVNGLNEQAQRVTDAAETIAYDELDGEYSEQAYDELRNALRQLEGYVSRIKQEYSI